MVGKFDASVSDAFAIKTLGPATVYVISTSVQLPSPAVMATFSVGNFTGDVIQIDPSIDADGLDYNPNTIFSGPGWASYVHFTPATGANIPNDFVPVEVTLTNNPPGSTTWDIDWNINGDIISDAGVTLSIDNTGMLEFAIGSVFSNNVPDEVYYVGALAVQGDSILIFEEDWSSGDFIAGGWTVTGDASVVAPPSPPAPPSTQNHMPLWRWAVTSLDGAIITFLDRLASNRVVQPNLNAPLQMSGTVPSDSPEINVLHTDNLPFLAEGARQLLGFRREHDDVDTSPCPTGHGYYTLRAATLILQTTDQSGSGDARTSFSAWDPWQYLFYRPIWIEALGGGSGPDRLIPQAGHTYDPSWTMDQIVVNIFDRMVTNADTADPSSAIKHSFIDWGWSAFYGDDCTGSEIQTCAMSADGWHIEPGTSIGQAIQDICSAGYMDIVLTPIYDPTNRPGVLCEVSIFAQSSDPDSGAGSRNYGAQFAWDAPGRSLVGFDDLIDGTQRANEVQYRNGTAGPLVTLQRDATSIGMYGEYWAEQSFPAQTQAVAVEAIAAEQLVLRKTYKQTLSVNPAPERSPEPFVDYYIGDRVPVFLGKAQRGGYALGDNSPRQALPPGYVGSVPVPDPAVFVWQRVYGIPVNIDDNGVETVTELLVGPIGPPV